MDRAKAKRMLSPQRIMGIILAILLLVGLAGAIGCSQGGEQPSAPAIKQGGKELTIVESQITGVEFKILYALTKVKNTGSQPIAYAELEMQFYKATGEPAETSDSGTFIIKDLAPGEVQNLYIMFGPEFARGMGLYWAGSFKIKVSKLQ